MKAWHYTGQPNTIELVNIPEPEVKPGWVVINVEAAGMCHSDVGIVDGTGQGWISKIPIVLGHEVAGTITDIGEGVSGFNVGDRVGVGLFRIPGETKKGLGSHEGPNAGSAPGLYVDGGYAEKALVRAERLVHIPDNVSFEEAAVAVDAIATAYHAVRDTEDIRIGDVVGIIGLGGLGMNGLIIAAMAGATVYGVDINESTFDTAIQNGAKACFTEVRELKHLKPNVIIDFAGFGTTTAEAIKAVVDGGRVVQVGMGKNKATINTAALVTKRVELKGSLGSTKEELEQIYELLSKGKLPLNLTEVPFDELDLALQQFIKGETTGRIFTRPRANLER